METTALETFVVVAEENSFSRAAEKLFLTQPAVSKRIAALEDELSAQLFDRIGKRIILTEAGKVLMPSAKRILDEIKDSHRLITNLSHRVSGALRISTSHHIGLHRLPPVLRAFTSEYPEVQLDIQFLDSEEGCLAVEQGKIELAIVTLPEKPAAILDIKKIWDDPLVVVTGNEHPLSSCKSIALQVLTEHQAILPGKNTFTRHIIEQAFLKSAIEVNVMFESNYLETIKVMVSIGLGWSILPLSMLDKELKSVSITGFTLQRTLGVVKHKKRSLSNAADALFNTIIKT